MGAEDGVILFSIDLPRVSPRTPLFRVDLPTPGTSEPYDPAEDPPEPTKKPAPWGARPGRRRST